MDPYSTALHSAVSTHAESWLRRCVSNVTGGAGISVPPDECDVVVGQTLEAIDASLRDVLGMDPERQTRSPLQAIRASMQTLNHYLLSVGCVPLRRDDVETSMLPDDIFGLGPVAWRDLGEEVHEAGIVWGAWKAATVMSRHRGSGEDRR